ncbi:MAG: glycosyl transferase family 4 [Desulfurococcales archaeon]|nr:glycosyl transferase family 4 [Desulfurococcales archaeon]
MQTGSIDIQMIVEMILAGMVATILNLFLTRTWISLTVKGDLFLVPDKNKLGYPKASAAGGTFTLASITLGLLTFEIMRIYLHGSEFYKPEIMALALMASLSTLLGFVDDVLSLLSYSKETAVSGLSPKTRVLLMAPISLPLVAIKAGYSKLDVPFIGVVDLGIAYPLVAVPIGVIGASNAFNMLAGYNGLEAGMGILLLLSALLVGIVKGLDLVILASLIGIAAILGFLYYNKYPAKTFPGNSFTYGIGAYYAGIVILGNFEKIGVAVFLLYFIEFFLYIRSKKDKVKKVNFAKICDDGSHAPPLSKAYSVTHLALKLLVKLKRKDCPTGVREKDVVYIILFIQAIIIGVTLTILL